jgi:hypothetical protein
MGFRRSVFLVFVLAVLAPAQTPKKAVPSSVQYQVYNAVLALMQFPKENALLKIADTTLNTGCGDASGNPVLMNGCGMFGPPTTAEATYAPARHALPSMERSTWEALLSESKSSTVLHDSFQSAWSHEVFNITKAAEGRKADGIIFLSPVGLSSNGKEALVYVLFFSYMEHVSTSANLFLLRTNQAGDWVPAGRFTVMETQ